MADPGGDKLYVNIGASQARRRLKGFGHGVRKIQAAGRNRAVIIHTATGRHLQELQSQFTDVGFSAIESDLAEPIENLKNVGHTSATWLRAAGICTIADLERVGPVAAYRLIKQAEPNAGLNLLWAIAAGLNDQDWRDLPSATKNRLQAELVGVELKPC